MLGCVIHTNAYGAESTEDVGDSRLKTYLFRLTRTLLGLCMRKMEENLSLTGQEELTGP